MGDIFVCVFVPGVQLVPFVEIVEMSSCHIRFRRWFVGLLFCNNTVDSYVCWSSSMIPGRWKSLMLMSVHIALGTFT